MFEMDLGGIYFFDDVFALHRMNRLKVQLSVELTAEFSFIRRNNKIIISTVLNRIFWH